MLIWNLVLLKGGLKRQMTLSDLFMHPITSAMHEYTRVKIGPYGLYYWS
jgi:hypothetical protein